MESYCVYDRARTKDVLGSTEVFITKNGRIRIQSICVKCGKLKSRFISQSGGTILASGIEESLGRLPSYIGSGIDIHKLIGKLPKPKKGFSLPGYNYAGPYNPLEKQVKFDPETGEIHDVYQKPSGKTDAVAMQHDVDYTLCGDDKKCKNKADAKMVKALDSIPWKERQLSHAGVRNVIAAKQKLGLGIKKK